MAEEFVLPYYNNRMSTPFSEYAGNVFYNNTQEDSNIGILDIAFKTNNHKIYFNKDMSFTFYNCFLLDTNITDWTVND